MRVKLALHNGKCPKCKKKIVSYRHRIVSTGGPWYHETCVPGIQLSLKLEVK